MITNIKAVLAVLSILSFPVAGQVHTDGHDVEAMQKSINGLLSGKGTNDILIYVSDGEYQEQSPSAEEIRQSYHDAEITFFKFVSPDPSQATVVARTRFADRKEEYHTFVLTKRSNSNWKVVCWHKSHS